MDTADCPVRSGITFTSESIVQEKDQVTIAKNKLLLTTIDLGTFYL